MSTPAADPVANTRALLDLVDFTLREIPEGEMAATLRGFRLTLDHQVEQGRNVTDSHLGQWRELLGALRERAAGVPR